MKLEIECDVCGKVAEVDVMVVLGKVRLPCGHMYYFGGLQDVVEGEEVD